MTLKEIRVAIQGIKAQKGDYEKAHGLEDELYRGFVEAIAKGTIKRPRRRAEEILKTKKFKFSRYSA